MLSIFDCRVRVYIPADPRFRLILIFAVGYFLIHRRITRVSTWTAWLNRKLSLRDGISIPWTLGKSIRGNKHALNFYTIANWTIWLILSIYMLPICNAFSYGAPSYWYEFMFMLRIKPIIWIMLKQILYKCNTECGLWYLSISSNLIIFFNAHI